MPVTESFHFLQCITKKKNCSVPFKTQFVSCLCEQVKEMQLEPVSSANYKTPQTHMYINSLPSGPTVFAFNVTFHRATRINAHFFVFLSLIYLFIELHVTRLFTKQPFCYVQTAWQFWLHTTHNQHNLSLSKI